MNEVEHFFDAEIEQAEERIANGDTMCFNGVKVGKTIGKELNEKHIVFCENAKRALADAINESDCRIAEMQKHIDRLEADRSELRTRCKGSVADDYFDSHLYGLLNIVGREDLHPKQELPGESIKVAEMLIYATCTYETSSLARAFGAGDTQTCNIYSKSDLRQIAEHLLVYCNNSEDE